MAATARGCQTVTAEENELRRRAAKARQNAVRKARAEAEKKAQENYSLGFDFVSTESREDFFYRQKMKPQWEYEDKLKAESTVIFNEWVTQLAAGKMVKIDMTEGDPVRMLARERMLDVVEALPEKYSRTYYEEYVLIAIARPA